MHFHKTIFPNGLRLITIPMKNHPTVTVTVLVEAGSKYETKPISGISHFLEHMCFKGTLLRPKPIDIVKELDSIGAQYNAFTAQEFAGYLAKADKRHFRTILDVVSDIYLNSSLPPAEIEKEKGVIVEEIKMYQDLPPRHVGDVLLSLLYGDQPAGWDVAGNEQTVRAVSREKLAKYRSAHYVPCATVVVVAGDVSLSEARVATSAAFAHTKKEMKTGKKAVIEKQKAPKIKIEYKKTDQVHLALGIRTVAVGHADLDALKVMTCVLSGGMSSRLFQKMRDELGICYYVNGSQNSFTDHGFLDVSAGVPLARFSEALAAILAELRRLKEEPVSANELKRVKNYLSGTLLLSLETSDSVADFYGAQEILHRPLRTPEEVLRRIGTVTGDDITRVARKYLTNARLNLASIGPQKDTKELKKLLHL